MMYKRPQIGKKVLLPLLLVVCGNLAAQSGFSIDFDGILGFAASQHDYATENNIVLDASFDLSIEGRNSLDANNALYYRVGGWVSYSRYKEFQFHVRDLAVELAIGEATPVQFNLNLGRQLFTDPTGKIIDQELDGLNASLKTDIISAHLGLGYLGLFPANHNNIRLSPDDEQEKDNEDWGTAPDRFLILGDFNIHFTPPITLGLHLGTQIDLREDPSSSSYGFTSWYAGIHSYGYVFELLEYSAQFSLSGGHPSNNPDPEVGILFSNYWIFTFPGEGVGRISAGIDASSPNFNAISSIKQGEYFKGNINKLLALGWKIEWEPFALSEFVWLRDLNIYVKGKHFWNTSPDARTVGVLKPVDSVFFGHELSMGFDMSPFSDFGFNGSMGAVLGNSTGEALFFSSIFMYLKI